MTCAPTRRLILASALLAPVAAARAQASGPGAPIEALDNGLLGIMRAGQSTPFPQRMSMLQPLVQQAFDLQTILRVVVGPVYASLPPQQVSDLLAAFTDYTVATYVSNFDSYSGQRFEVSPQTRATGNDQIVQTQLISSSGSATRLDYVMRQTGDGWRAVDVLVDGTISRAAVQRSDFRSLLHSGNAERLIASLRAKVEGLSRGEKS